MSNHDLEALVRGGGDPLERKVLESARTDVPPSNAKEQMLASLGLAKPASEMRAPTPAPRKIGGRYVYGVGLALVIGAGAAAIVSSSRVDKAPPSMPNVPSVVSEVAAAATVAEPVIPRSPPIALRVGEPVARPEPAIVEAPVERAPAASPVRKQEAASPPISARREPAPSMAVSVASASTPPKPTPSASPSASGGGADAAESTLARELARVAAARSALASGDSASTLQLLDSYDREFPGGVFAVEVSVLRIEALTRSGKLEEATRLGDRFLALHPRGALARRVVVTLKGAKASPSASAPATSRD